MQYYAAFAAILILGIMTAVVSGAAEIPLLVGGLVGLLASAGLANVLAGVKLRNSYAQIFFLDDHISVLSVYDILYSNQPHAFPLQYTNPQRSGELIQIHYGDQILSLKQEDWGEDFEQIWVRLLSPPLSSQLQTT